ncbi:MAG TPA: hypothetical protein VJ694_04865 [Patescibacteria group bacterium]|nr:hypothetical protein [Patescibacteria group bacterium]
MLDVKLIKQSLPYSAGALLYVAVVATVMRNAERLFGGDKPDSALAPVGILLLLVTSAATMGMLIFGKPLMLYIDGKKREGVMMAVYTIGQLAAFTVLVFVFIAARG